MSEPVKKYAKPLDSYHEDMGPVVWWKFPIDEPAWIGSPHDGDWPGYHTHFTPHPDIPEPLPYYFEQRHPKPQG